MYIDNMALALLAALSFPEEGQYHNARKLRRFMSITPVS